MICRALGGHTHRGHPRPRVDLLPWASGAETTVEYNDDDNNEKKKCLSLVCKQLRIRTANRGSGKEQQNLKRRNCLFGDKQFLL